MTQRNGEHRQCVICDKRYYISGYRIGTSQYCSMKCLGVSKIGKIPPNVWKKGQHSSPATEFKKGMVAPMKGRKFTEEHVRKMIESRQRNKRQMGENHYNWQGGKSFLPYTPEFNNELKRFIRKRDGYKCSLCKKTEYQERKELNRNLSIDHINGDKQNNLLENLRPLCNRCNSSEMQRLRKLRLSNVK